jgi:hypothetical protein
MTGWVLVLKCLLLGACGCLRSYPIMSGIQCCYLREPGPSVPPGTESPSVDATVSGLLRAGLRGGSMVGGQVVKSCPFAIVVMRWRISMGRSHI